jgi:DNA-binding transcriptional MerR regulator
MGSVSTLTVSKLARQVGTSPDTLRYYERIGLLPPPERTPSGYRVYGEETAERVRFIKQAQRVGLRLDHIAELLRIREQGLCPCGRTRSLLEARLAELDQEMAELARLRGQIVAMLDGELGAESQPWQCGDGLIQLTPRPVNHRPVNQSQEGERP